VEEVEGEVRAIQCGGHFDGSLVLLWEKKLFIADTMMSVPVCVAVLLTPNCLLRRSSLDSITKTAFQALSATHSNGRIQIVSLNFLHRHHSPRHCQNICNINY
jgi:hypothetical protein